MKTITIKKIIVIAFIFAINFTNAQVFMDCENNTYNALSFNVFANGTGESNADITIVNNPTIAGVNTSLKVAKFLRRTDPSSTVFAGAFSGLTGVTADFTVKKYVHVKVLKNKLSPTKFKIEGGSTGNIEKASTLPYATLGVWQDMVFDFTTATGLYPTVVFFPDFEEPLTNTGNINIYFDEIYLSNSPTPDTASFLGVNSNNISSNVSIYPSLVKDTFTIENLEALQSIQIITLDCKTVKQFNNIEIGQNKIDISDLSSGIYLLNISSKSGYLTKKIVKN